MVEGLGIDITSIDRIAQLVDRYDCEALTLLFTPREIECAQNYNYPHLFYAIFFASKEAVGKALGTGLVGIDWQEIEARIQEDCGLTESKNCSDQTYLSLIYDKFSLPKPAHRLEICLYGKARIRAKQRGFREWLATWCYWDEHVLVHVLAQ